MTIRSIRGLRLIETLGGSIFGVGLMLTSITNWQDWRAYAVQIMALILICITELWLQDDEFKKQKEHAMTKPTESRLPMPTPTPPPLLPITDGEREKLNELQQRINGPVWWSDFEADHSYRLFNAPWTEHHGYQVLKAPTQRQAGEKFQAYTPTPVEDEYIVHALNAIPRYEERLRELEEQCDLLYDEAWLRAEHEKGCPSWGLPVGQMQVRCVCATGDALRARARKG